MLKLVDDILVVSPQTSTREQLENYLTTLKYENIETRLTAFEAIKRITNKEFKLVIVDNKLLGASGVEILSQLQSEEITYGYMIILGTPDREELLLSAKYGALWLEKPIEYSKLANLLTQLNKGT